MTRLVTTRLDELLPGYAVEETNEPVIPLATLNRSFWRRGAAQRWATHMNQQRSVPSFRWEVFRRGLRWTCVPMQNRLVKL